jgi:hypothetical protein
MANDQQSAAFNQNSGQARQPDVAKVATQAVPRMYRFRTNAKAGLNGAFNGTCLVLNGDEFTLVLHPYLKKGKNGAPDQLVDRKLPTWADVIEEYEIPKPPKVIRKVDAPKP